MARDFVGESPMARFTPSRRPGAGPGSRRDAGSGRANGTVRVVPAASSFAVADDVAIVFGGQERPGPQQEREEDEPAQGERGAIQEVLRLAEVVEDRTRVDCQQFLWITPARPGVAVNRNAGLRGAAGLREK